MNHISKAAATVVTIPSAAKPAVSQTAKLFLALGALTFGWVSGANADAVTGWPCKTSSSSFSIIKHYDSASMFTGIRWYLTYEGRPVYTFSEAELHDLFGGDKPAYPCWDVVGKDGSIGLVEGRERDLFIAFGVERSNGRVVGVNMLRYYPHDGMISAPSNSTEFQLTYGREHDLHARFCWNSENNTWYHNADHRAGMGPCVANTWPWTYTSSQTEVKFN